jgi:hypothetical protein
LYVAVAVEVVVQEKPGILPVIPLPVMPLAYTAAMADLDLAAIFPVTRPFTQVAVAVDLDLAALQMSMPFMSLALAAVAVVTPALEPTVIRPAVAVLILVVVAVALQK